MSDTWNIVLKISISEGEVATLTEEYTLPKLSFRKMANASDGFFELLEKLLRKI